ncbi:toxin YdaT domain-containing protein [Vibrio sp. JC009]|uniref:toxin YdaT family protein n=1 Tax=Vibrio sp. JC009 TaxID=2912314 RepID=UPI0023AFB9C5|nr:toxin YdaT family protein [Vibrio sp. JC009]WED23057.1 toxin YdaT domain-containing protein [Vibrio sp. JC009]
MIISLKTVIRNAIESWRTELSKECIAHKAALFYHKLDIPNEVDAQRKLLLKVPGADDKNNAQNFFRYIDRSSVEAKATIMDLLPAILKALPAERACTALNQFLNPLGFSVAKIGSTNTHADRDALLADFNKESSEAFRAILLLPETATIDQLRAAYKEVQESAGSHEPLMNYLEKLITLKS